MVDIDIEARRVGLVYTVLVMQSDDVYRGEVDSEETGKYTGPMKCQ